MEPTQPPRRSAMTLASAHAADSAALTTNIGGVVHGAEPIDENAELVCVPASHRLRAMDISPHHAHLYQRMFGIRKQANLFYVLWMQWQAHVVGTLGFVCSGELLSTTIP